MRTLLYHVLWLLSLLPVFFKITMERCAPSLFWLCGVGGCLLCWCTRCVDTLHALPCLVAQPTVQKLRFLCSKFLSFVWQLLRTRCLKNCRVSARCSVGEVVCGFVQGIACVYKEGTDAFRLSTLPRDGFFSFIHSFIHSFCLWLRRGVFSFFFFLFSSAVDSHLCTRLERNR